MMVVAIVAIIFVGPKELPGMLRTFGRTVRKVRAMAGDFQRQFDDALRETELDSVRDDLNKVRQLNPVNKIKDHLNPIRDDLAGIAGEKRQPDTDYDPETLFDEAKAPEGPKPQKVDVEAALQREAETTAAAAPSPKPKAAGKKAPSAAGKTATKPKTGPKTKTTAAKPKAAAKPRTAKPAAKRTKKAEA